MVRIVIRSEKEHKQILDRLADSSFARKCKRGFGAEIADDFAAMVDAVVAYETKHFPHATRDGVGPAAEEDP